jgi:hypothetical protein
MTFQEQRFLGRLEEITDTTNSFNIGTTAQFAEGNWYFIYTVWSTAEPLAADAIHIWVDGIQQATFTVTGYYGPGASYNNTGHLVAGSSDLFSEFFFGDVDDIRVYNRALSEAEIAELLEDHCSDHDGDGFRPPSDCNDGDSAVNPDASELPGNFVDENCDGNLGACSPCFPWKNHGEYVKCVAHAVNELVMAGEISEDEGNELVSSAASSAVGKKGYVPPGCE